MHGARRLCQSIFVAISRPGFATKSPDRPTHKLYSVHAPARCPEYSGVNHGTLSTERPESAPEPIDCVPCSYGSAATRSHRLPTSQQSESCPLTAGQIPRHVVFHNTESGVASDSERRAVLPEVVALQRVILTPGRFHSRFSPGALWLVPNPLCPGTGRARSVRPSSTSSPWLGSPSSAPAARPGNTAAPGSGSKPRSNACARKSPWATARHSRTPCRSRMVL